MKAPSPPPTPDPFKTANAQQVANVEVALANTYLQNADEDRPDGAVRFVATGETLATFTYDASGNATGSRAVPKYKKITTLSAKGLIAFDKQQDLAVLSNTVALAQMENVNDIVSQRLSLSTLPTRFGNPTAPVLTTAVPGEFAFVTAIGAVDPVAHVTATRDAILDRLEYQYDLDRTRLEASMANQGLFPGMAAYDRAMLAIDRKSTDSRLQAFLAAQQEQTRLLQYEAMKGEFANTAGRMQFEQRLIIFTTSNSVRMQQFSALVEAANYVNTVRSQILQELVVERNQPLNEISALISGGQIQVPQFQNYRAGMIDKTPVAESVYRSADLDMQKYQAKLQQQQQMMGGIMGLAGNLIALPFSDRRLKTDILKLFDDSRGFGWYVWRYLWDAPGTNRVGVMAQEVVGVRGAVALDVSGFLTVDYRRLM